MAKQKNQPTIDSFDTFKEFEAWKKKKLAPYERAYRRAADAVLSAEKKLTATFLEFDADKGNEEKKRAWISALRSRDHKIKRRDQYAIARRDEDARLTVAEFHSERQEAPDV